MDILKTLAVEFELNSRHVENIVGLIDEGNTIPFIARYRKEQTGSCDDQLLREVFDRLAYLRNLEKRKQEVIQSIVTQEKMTDELMAAISAAERLAVVEDLYRPFKQKRRTRASVARESGLEPLAAIIFAQNIQSGCPEDLAAPFVDTEKGVSNIQDALSGALDIIAENLSDDAKLRGKLRDLAYSNALLNSVGSKDEDSVYRLYYDYAEPVSKIPSHRLLAINRGEAEGFLRVSMEIGEAATNLIDRFTVKEGSITSDLVRQAAADSWKRLIHPSLEREIRNDLTYRANEQAIKMFGQNLKPLLMQPPVHAKAILAVDPAYRTGCKIAVIDSTGMVLDTTVIYPTPPQNKIEDSRKTIKNLVTKHQVEVIAIGNGTASKESEIFIAETIRELRETMKEGAEKVSYTMVNEAGASVYSASKLAATEFPEFDVSLRSAISIARRLQDPLAELVKIDPKAIGVGQYQHDMPVVRLDETLAGVVEDCVNSVGVNVSTASAALLSYVAGLNKTTSKNIVSYREEHGSFTSRTQLKKVPKLGGKTFEQCAGFLRISGGKSILDNTAVHPESYSAAKKLLELFGHSEDDLKAGNVQDLSKKVKAHGWEKAALACDVGVPTLKDIVEELSKPGRDIRESLPSPILRDDILDAKDLQPGMKLTGTVRNVIDFGAFVDIGVHQDGLVHISQMADRYISHPSEVAKVGDIVKVEVLEIDLEKKRISLKMKGLN
ncbi:MAG: RNA-binding transcriptional accessory protein [Coriobacteriales bacterium]|nr:RNA-binding transcriptional accessory protein [Coriobacteriales bacterium]